MSDLARSLLAFIAKLGVCWYAIPGKVAVAVYVHFTGMIKQLIYYKKINVLFITTLSAQMDTNQ